MGIHFSVSKVDIDPKAIANSTAKTDKVGKFAASQWHRLYLPYVPMRTGMLMNIVDLSAPWKITHTSIYAAYQYYGVGFKFFKGMHPKATAKWDQAAKGIQGNALAKAIEAYIKKGG